MTFDWHKNRESFLSWVVTTTLPHFKNDQKFEELSAATDKFRSISITMQINGIEVNDAEKFLDRLYAEYTYQVKKHAKELVKEHTQYAEAEDIVDSVFKEARNSIRKQFETKLGLIITDDD